MLSVSRPVTRSAPGSEPGDAEWFAMLRGTEYRRLDATGTTYLDYTGAALPAESHVRAHLTLLCDSVLGNPHSESPASRASTHWIGCARARVLEFFHADPVEYEVIFTANASAAIRLVGESYPFSSGSRLVLSTDNHNSVNGLREHARRAGATTTYVPLDRELRLDGAVVEGTLAEPTSGGLFGYPAQSNFSGVRHPLELVRVASDAGYDVLLDAAAFVPTSPLNLRAVPADFVALSFYKMFGYPTGVGALIAKRAALAKLRRPAFAGGTVDWVSVQHSRHALRQGADGFEDGTPDFLAMPAVIAGLDQLSRTGMAAVTRHVDALTALLLGELQALRHRNDAPVVWIHGPASTRSRGGTVALNVLRPDGVVIPFQDVESRAAARNVSLRGGCFCNPGASERAFEFPAHTTARCLDAAEREGFSMERFARCTGARAVGAIRISLGIPSNTADVGRAVELIASFAQ